MATTTSNAVTLTAKRPRRDWVKIISIVLAVIEVGIAGYLTYADVLHAPVVCTKGGFWNCDAVQTSSYAYIGPIPVAVLGLAGALGILLVLILESFVPFFAARGRLLVFGMGLFGLVMSGYLTAVEAFVLHAWCIWCVGSAITMVLLFILSFVRLWQAISAVPDEAEEAAE